MSKPLASKRKRRGYWLAAAGFLFLCSSAAIVCSMISPIVVQEEEECRIPIDDENLRDGDWCFVEAHFFNFALLDGNVHYDQSRAGMIGTVTSYGGLPKINRSMPCFSRMRRIGGITMPMLWWESANFEVIATSSQLFRVTSTQGVIIPLWPIALGSLILAIVLAARAVWLRRRLKNACMNCHYDLTGNESGVCPECGTHVPMNSPVLDK